MNILRFQKQYFILAILLFVTEVLIAAYVHDGVVRPYIGDLLVVMLIYCFVRSFLNSPVLHTAIAVLLFAYLIEILQYFHLVRLLGLQHYRLAWIVLGSSFEWIDLIVYTVGIAIVLVLEKKIRGAESITPH